MHKVLNSSRMVLKDLGARKAEKATWAHLLWERERMGSGGASSLPSVWGGGGGGRRNGLASNGGCLHGLGIRSIYSSPGPKTTTISGCSK
jgi:hypothetical protein